MCQGLGILGLKFASLIAESASDSLRSDVSGSGMRVWGIGHLGLVDPNLYRKSRCHFAAS